MSTHQSGGRRLTMAVLCLILSGLALLLWARLKLVTGVTRTAYAEPKPTQVPWPTDLGVTLAGAVDCARVDAAKIGTLFADATQLTFFVEDGTTYAVSAVAVLPGDRC